MGMSTLPVKPRGRVRWRAKAGDSGSAEPKSRVSVGSFLKPDKQVGGRQGDYGSGEGDDTRSHDLRRPSTKARAIVAPQQLLESHTCKISSQTESSSPNSTALATA